MGCRCNSAPLLAGLFSAPSEEGINAKAGLGDQSPWSTAVLIGQRTARDNGRLTLCFVSVTLAVGTVTHPPGCLRMWLVVVALLLHSVLAVLTGTWGHVREGEKTKADHAAREQGAPVSAVLDWAGNVRPCVGMRQAGSRSMRPLLPGAIDWRLNTSRRQVLMV
ncbi:hypothetical protein BaRGS_00001632, partial [Batillaria attramentaria]